VTAVSASISEHRCVHSHASACDVRCYIYALEVVSEAKLSEFKFWVTMRRMSTVVLEPVEVLVTLSAHLAAIRLLLLHADGSGVRNRCQRIDYRERPVVVLLELLILVAMLLQC
jgi:fumarate reductase subunit C